MRLIVIFMIISASLNSFACDNCGGGGLGLDANILSANNGNSIGLLTNIKRYKTYVEGAEEKNFLINLTLNGSYQPHKLIQIKFYVPLYFQRNSYVDTKSVGLGDALTILTVNALDRKVKAQKIQHRLLFSAGLELPTGLYQNDTENSSNSIPFGSKSWDFVMGSSYAFRVNDYILSGNFMAKVTTTNSNNFKFGNTVEALLQNTYKIEVKDAQLFPYIGAKLNWQSMDISNNYYRIFTGGYVFSEIMGLQFNYYQYKLAMNIEIPFSRHLNNKDLVVGNTYGIQFTYTF